MKGKAKTNKLTKTSLGRNNKESSFYLFVEILSLTKSVFLFVTSWVSCEVDSEMEISKHGIY